MFPLAPSRTSREPRVCSLITHLWIGRHDSFINFNKERYSGRMGERNSGSQGFGGKSVRDYAMPHGKFSNQLSDPGSETATGMQDTEAVRDADDVLFAEDFESYTSGDVPSEFVLAGNTSQEVTTRTTATGSQSYQMNGTHGGCWRAIARTPVELEDEMTIQGYFMRGVGEPGCHSGSGGLRFRTAMSESWDEGTGTNLLRFFADGTVESNGNWVGDYGIDEWTYF